ncbi:MAG: glycine cleavage system protein GcvH [Candidatus Competibacteraceae bacterium]
MSQIPADLKYTRDHEWARLNPDGSVTVGITEYAQRKLGDMVFVELPEPGRMVTAGQECAVVESVKAASEVYSPVAGKVTAVNEALEEEPERVNDDPYGDGWILRLQPSETLDGLMEAAAYEQYLQGLE